MQTPAHVSHHPDGAALGAKHLDPRSLITSLNVQPGMKVADFGCGGGHFTLALSRAVGESGAVYAYDVQLPPLEMLRERAKHLGYKNIQAIRANLEVPGSTTLSDHTVDLVLMANVLFQSPNKQAILQEAKRILQQGGRLVLIEWRKGAGGFGPPDDLRMEDTAIRALVSGQGFTPGQELRIGDFHEVMIFTLS